MDDDATYEDTHNDEPVVCSFGTMQDDGIWFNNGDPAGNIMAGIVWLLILYSVLTVLMLAQHGHVSVFIAAVYCTVCALALASHAKTTFTDPGSVPSGAIPFDTGRQYHAVCAACQTYKPPCAHHCRICNRCISRMDHHCPWMNNCIGQCNMKHFILFLVYTWTGSIFCLIIFVVNYFFCSRDDCEFGLVETQLVRTMAVITLGALLFTSSMLMNVVYIIVTGIGTIDRLKMKADDTWHNADQSSMDLEVIFGIQGLWSWWLPIDPLFRDFDRVVGFSTRQRLLRERSTITSQLEV